MDKKESPKIIKRLYIQAGPEIDDEFSLNWKYVLAKRKDVFDLALKQARYRNFENLFRYYVRDIEVSREEWDDSYSYRTSRESIKVIKSRELTRKKVDKLFI